MSESILKVVKINDIHGYGGLLKLIIFQEYRVNDVLVSNGKFGSRLLLKENRNEAEGELLKDYFQSWEGDPLFSKIYYDAFVAGKIVTYKMIDGNDFNCATFSSDHNDFEVAKKQLFYQRVMMAKLVDD